MGRRGLTKSKPGPSAAPKKRRCGYCAGPLVDGEVCTRRACESKRELGERTLPKSWALRGCGS